ncbi:IS1106 transposase [Neisseria meningitidis]|nr:IS1106 transposase [Neisseria meningitidis]CWT81801.1 IS1106 transposase [Neisseria meningitidis]
MSTFFQQTAQAMIAKHIDRFPLLKLDQVIDWQPIEQYLNRQKPVTSETTAAVLPIPCCPCSKPSCSDNGTASPIPNSNTASSPASISTCFAVLTN